MRGAVGLRAHLNPFIDAAGEVVGLRADLSPI